MEIGIRWDLRFLPFETISMWTCELNAMCGYTRRRCTIHPELEYTVGIFPFPSLELVEPRIRNDHVRHVDRPSRVAESSEKIGAKGREPWERNRWIEAERKQEGGGRDEATSDPKRWAGNERVDQGEIRKFHTGLSGPFLYLGSLPRQRSCRTKGCPATTAHNRSEATRSAQAKMDDSDDMQDLADFDASEFDVDAGA